VTGRMDTGQTCMHRHAECTDELLDNLEAHCLLSNCGWQRCKNYFSTQRFHMILTFNDSLAAFIAQ